MKVLSVKQPWAYLICAGIKDVENRTWKCPQKYIGQRVLIHASAKSWSWNKILEHLTIPMSNVFLKMGFDCDWLRDLHTSSIIGSVEIVDCVKSHPSIWADKSISIHLGDEVRVMWSYKWVFANPVLFYNPTPAKGKLGFWDFDGKIIN